jgi:hypothetical protein
MDYYLFAKICAILVGFGKKLLIVDKADFEVHGAYSALICCIFFKNYVV